MNDTSRHRQVRQWSMLVHFSLLVTILHPLALILPVVIWQIKKADLPEIDPHGKAVVNWLISLGIYTLLMMLIFYLSGFWQLIFPFGFMWLLPGAIIAQLGWIIFPLIAGIKAGNGKTWRYPLSLRFLK